MEEWSWTLLLALFIVMPLLLAWSWITYARIKGSAERRERAAAREAWERVMHEKLDVLKTAIVMGYDYSELSELDRRLGSLIGEERMQALLQERHVPAAPSLDLTSIEADVAAVVQLAREHRQRG